MVPVIEQRMIVPNVHVLTVEAPDVAESAQPGNFVILRPTEEGERIPLTIADWDADAGTVTSIFVQVGASTARLARLKAGDHIPSYAGPLGNATEIGKFGTVLLIAGCYGMGASSPSPARSPRPATGSSSSSRRAARTCSTGRTAWPRWRSASSSSRGTGAAGTRAT